MKEIKNIFYVNTVYSLLIVLMLRPNLEENLYFFNDDFPKIISDKFQNKVILKKYKNQIKIFRYYMVRRFLKKIKKEYSKTLENKVFFIQDHLTYGQFFLNNFEKSRFYLIEDGIGNYNLSNLERAKKNNVKYLYKYMNFIKTSYPTLGISEKIKKIYLTGLLPIPKILEEKVKIINIKELWQKIPEREKIGILKIFDIELEELKKLTSSEEKILLITQPLSEDKIITEEEKINIYREIINKEKDKIIVIKPHPREKTDYKKAFFQYNIQIMKKEFPLELLSFLDIKFYKVITLFSTAALNFKDKYNVEFIGTEKYYKLYKWFGKIEY